MNRINQLSRVLILVLITLLSSSFAKPTRAIVPVIENVVVWQSGNDVIVNVTVSHSPVLISHRVNKIEVNVSGTNHVFNIIQNTTTFTYPCNIGPIEGNPTAQVRAHCIVDFYSAWTAPIQIPEFQFPALLLTFILSTALATFALYKNKLRRL
jgi:hypothetical protein